MESRQRPGEVGPGFVPPLKLKLKAGSGPERLEAGGEAPPPHPVYLVYRTPGVGFQSSRFPKPWLPAANRHFVNSAVGRGGLNGMEKRGKCLGKGVGSRLGVRARRDLEDDQREAMVWNEAFRLGWERAWRRGGV